MSKITALLMLIILSASCAKERSGMLVDSNSGLTFRLRNNDNVLMMSTRINTTSLGASGMAQVIHHFTKPGKDTYFYSGNDTVFPLDVQLERYFEAAPYDVVNYYFDSKAAFDSNELIINDPMLSDKRISFKINQIEP